MLYRYTTLISILVFILSSSILPFFAIRDITPSFIIVFLMVWALLYDKENTYLFAIVSGVMHDLFLGRILGFYLILYVAVVYYFLKISPLMFKGSFLTPIFLMITSTLGYYFLGYLILFFFQLNIPFKEMVNMMALEILFNVFFGFFIYKIFFKKVFGYKIGDYNA